MADEMTFKHVLPVQIRFNDVDQYGHMNNSSYFSLYDLAKTSYLRDVFGQKAVSYTHLTLPTILRV